MLIIQKYIFKFNISKAILTVSLTMIIYFIADAVFSIILLQFTTADILRGNETIMLLSNLGVGMFSSVLSNTSYIRKGLHLFIEKIDNSKVYDRIIFLILVLSAWVMIFYNLAPTINFGKELIINIIVMSILGTLIIIYVVEKIKSKELNDKNEGLMEYIENFEAIIEKVQLTTHEYKNQLATLRYMAAGTNDKKAQMYIDDILGDIVGIETKCAEELKHVPRGALKGLLYYKVIIADKNNIETVISISKNVHSYIKEISEAHIKSLCYLLGIYMDNAIEAAMESKDKKISIEFYITKNVLNIIIANTYKNNTNILSVNIKGFTTKGKGRGNGLYLASKIIRQESAIESETGQNEKYFIQKLTYNKEKR